MCLKLIRMENWVIVLLIVTIPSCFGLSIGVPLSDSTSTATEGEGDEYLDSLSPGEQVALILAILVTTFLLPSLCCWWLVRWIRGRQVGEEVDGQVVFMNMTSIREEESPNMTYNDTGHFRYIRGSSLPPDYDDHALFPTVNFSNDNISSNPITDDLPPPSFAEATRANNSKSTETESDRVVPTRGRKKWKTIIRRIITNRN